MGWRIVHGKLKCICRASLPFLFSEPHLFFADSWYKSVYDLCSHSLPAFQRSRWCFSNLAWNQAWKAWYGFRVLGSGCSQPGTTGSETPTTISPTKISSPFLLSHSITASQREVWGSSRAKLSWPVFNCWQGQCSNPLNLNGNPLSTILYYILLVSSNRSLLPSGKGAFIFFF